MCRDPLGVKLVRFKQTSMVGPLSRYFHFGIPATVRTKHISPMGLRMTSSMSLLVGARFP